MSDIEANEVEVTETVTYDINELLQRVMALERADAEEEAHVAALESAVTKLNDILKTVATN